MESPLCKLTTPSAHYHNAHLAAPSTDHSPLRNGFNVHHDSRADRGIFGLEDSRLDL